MHGLQSTPRAVLHNAPEQLISIWSNIAVTLIIFPSNNRSL